MGENIYVNEAFSPVKKITTTLIYYFIRTADGKLLMSVKDVKNVINKRRDAGRRRREEQVGLATQRAGSQVNPLWQEKR